MQHQPPLIPVAWRLTVATMIARTADVIAIAGRKLVLLALLSVAAEMMSITRTVLPLVRLVLRQLGEGKPDMGDI